MIDYVMHSKNEKNEKKKYKKIETCEDALEFIFSLKMHRTLKNSDILQKSTENNLQRFGKLCELFGNPQESYKTIHIAGTNGKGSSVTMTAEILEKFGYKTGRYISPYIVKFQERISVNGEDISETDLCRLTSHVREVLDNYIQDDENCLNQFEFITLVAFNYYRELKCDFVVLETGLGGQFDPTNIIKSPVASVITSIDYDHMAILGNTIEKITAAKCGIIKKNSICAVSVKNTDGVLRQIFDTAKRQNCEITVADKISAEKSILSKEITIDGSAFFYNNRKYKINLAGEHQIYNAITIIELVYRLTEKGILKPDGKSSESEERVYELICEALESVSFPARFEILSKFPLIIFDGAHNKSGIEALNKVICDVFGGCDVNLYSGMLEDKRPCEIIECLAKQEKNYNIVKFAAIPVNSPRAFDVKQYAAEAQKYFKNSCFIENIKHLREDISKNSVNNSVNIIFGSLYLASEVKNLIEFDGYK